MSYRIESDTMGEIKVDNEKFWGAQTQRSFENFKIGNEKIPLEIIYALTYIKKASAIANNRLGILPKDKMDVIIEAADEVLNHKLDEHFPLSIWQAGSGTQTNMNVNEVISNFAAFKKGGNLGSKIPVHPNDDVNKSQSSNDIFPAAMQISSAIEINKKLLPVISKLLDLLNSKSREFKDIIKSGRTHLQDAVPITLGQEFSGYAEQVKSSIKRIKYALEDVYDLPIGGTAVGTGLNAPKGFDKIVCELIAGFTGLPFKAAENKFAYMAAHDNLVNLSGAFNTFACALMKIANDIRWMASGPRCGLDELILPENEPGSSIMPGKVNPTQCEALVMVCMQVIGNNTTITIAGATGNFELNVNKPVIIFNILQSINILSDSIESFNDRCLIDIKANRKKISEYLSRTLMVVTALNPYIGYENSAKIAQLAKEKDITLKEAAMELSLLTADEFDKYVRPEKMI